MKNRFDQFSGPELYILSRQAIEASYNIVCETRFNGEKKYTDEEIKIHERLMNELIDARSARGVNGLNREG